MESSPDSYEIPVLLYAPNVLGYARIILALAGLYVSNERPVAAIFVWSLSALLDLVDGILARSLGHTTSSGINVDIAADTTNRSNLLRTCVWFAASTQETIMIPVAIVSLEWITMICTHLHAVEAGKQWKERRKKDPFLIRYIFSNNFKNPLGILSVYGQYAACICWYGRQHSVIYDNFPLFSFFQYTAYVGRGISMLCELWLCADYIKLVLQQYREGQDTHLTETDLGMVEKKSI